MTRVGLRWPGSAAVSLLAALTTWIALWAWAPFTEVASGFLVPTLGAVLMVAGSGMLLRSARVPALLVLLGQLAVLVLWLNRVWAPNLSWAGWLPTPESIAELGTRIALGVETAQAYAAPVPEEAPEIHALLIVAGAGTAVLVDFLAAGLRRAPLAGLPLLAVYTAPLSILAQGVAWWGFAACALSFLFLLTAEQSGRLAQWGRPAAEPSALFDTRRTTVSTAAMRTSARRIGVTATGLAVVVPLAVPTLSLAMFDGSGFGPGGDGDPVAISNPIVDLRRDLVRGENVELVHVRTEAPDPSYLRVSVLDEFDGKIWRPSGRDIPVEQRADGDLPPPPGLGGNVEREEWAWELSTTEAFESLWLPTPYPLSAVTAEGDWRYDVRTFDFISGTEDLAEDLEYGLTELRLRPTADHLASSGPADEAIVTPNTDLPDSMPDLVQDLARRVTAEGTTRFEKAVVLQRWFREDGGFTYSLDRAPGNGVDELERFLTEGPGGRVGYCEQFAAAMAVMSRSIGIPARVAVGFLRPQQTGPNTYVFGSLDLHAWPELYFDGTGWVRFEPTPASRASGVPAYTNETFPSAEPTDQQTARDGNAPEGRFDEETDARLPEGGGGATGGSDDGSPLTPAILVGFVLGLLVAAPWALRELVRRRRWSRVSTAAATAEAAEAAEAAWSELRDTALDLRLPWDDAVTLRSRARGLVTAFGPPQEAAVDGRARRSGADADPEATDALERLVRFVERSRYARSAETPPGLRADLERCVEALRNGASRQRRFWAAWLPASLVGDLRRGTPGRPASGSGALLAEPGVDRVV